MYRSDVGVKAVIYTRWIPIFLLGTSVMFAADINRAQQLFNRAQYEEAIRLLSSADQHDASAQLLLGKSYFVLGEFKKATDAFERLVAATPDHSEAYHWLGKAYGRRAETSNPLFAPSFASRARQNFEKAVQLDGRNLEAMNDLFSYYLEAPGFLGGGLDKAQDLAERMKALDPPEYHYDMAQIAERRKEFRTAEQHLRAAISLAPTQAGRVIDLGRFLSKQGRTQESEQVFAQAAKIAPDSPRLLFERASNLIRGKQDLDSARSMLQRYVKMPLSPDDPSRDEAYKLLKAAGA